MTFELAQYDPAWPGLFERERALVLGAIGRYARLVEHIGSTAVPGLAAKPIIDIMVGLDRIEDSAGCILPIEGLGYEYVREFEVTMPHRRYFRKLEGGRETHHIHMVELTHEFWRRLLLFRDVLRSRPDIAREYEALKRSLAVRHANDVEAYTEAKTPFIRTVEKQTDAIQR